MSLAMKTETKEYLLGSALALVAFWLLCKTVLRKSEEIVRPAITQENIDIAVSAYMSAVQNNEPQAVLNDLNKSTSKDYGVRVYQNKSDGAFVVTDLDGKEVRRVA